MSSPVVFAEVINKRKKGLDHTPEELEYLIASYVQGTLPDYQVAAWLMATYFNGLSKENTATLTQIMKDSGESLSFPEDVFVIDKHSTGGIGDKCTLILAPLVASCGIKVASLAGRGLGHSGGTLDKLESIPGFQVYISKEALVENVLRSNLCIAGQTSDICPADKKLYSLRDVTSTVDSLSLITASIMSKKLAEGLKALVLDVKFGSGAFMKTLEEADTLATWLKDIGVRNGLKVRALITDMDQPMGRFAGNALEVKECIDILKNKTCIENNFDFYSDTRELSLQLASHMLVLASKASTPEEAYELLCEQLRNGQAYDKFLEMCKNQGANSLDTLPQAQYSKEVYSTQSGFVSAINTEEIGYAAIHLKAGRLKTTDTIDPASGIEWHFKKNHRVQSGDKLFTLYANDKALFNSVEKKLLACLTFSQAQGTEYQLIEKILI